MFTWILKRTIGTKNDRELRKLRPMVQKIKRQEEEYQKLTDEQIRAKSDEFKQRLQNGETLNDIMIEAFAVVKNVCRRLMGKKWDVCGIEIEWDMIPYDVQLMGAIVLHQGKIAEMATGEGKTLVATMPLYLNALTGRNVHLVTVNDYLARRDAQWMGKIYEFLGLKVGCLQNQMPHEEKLAAYQADITYGTNSEFGFDYLRDNGMAMSKEDIVQRGHYYAIIDEVDSILIDEARTPLIITAPVSVSTHKFDRLKPSVEQLVHKQTMQCNRLMKEARELFENDDGREEAAIRLFQVSRGAPKNRQFLKMLEEPAAQKLLEKTSLSLLSDMRKEELENIKEELYFIIDEKGHDIELTENGRQTLAPNDPESFVLPDMILAEQQIDEDPNLPEDEKERKKRRVDEEFAHKSETLHNISQLLRAYSLYEKDVEYVVQDNRVIIVDEFTGRLLPGRRYSEGLHQALEAKEGVTIEKETQTFATITIQNYFRLYEKLAGMTGTAETEAAEFKQIYKLDVIVVPTNEPVRRIDANDAIYKTKREKYAAIIEEVAKWHSRGRPILIGTISVDTSEILSRYLKRRGIPHNVLNAKYHQKEAEIIARAGQPGAVTIATNMAGRGTDIKLGKRIVPRELVEYIEAHPGPNDWQKWKMVTDGETLVPGDFGLCVIGTERHEARRIDRQLRGRCARQGDPGGSKFYVSLEDDLMRLFGSERIANIMTRIGLEEGQELAHPLLNKSIETAQKRVEQRNFSIRKHTLEYDDVMNKQREVIYDYRSRTLFDEELKPYVFEFIEELLDEKVNEYLLEKADPEQWNIRGLIRWVNTTFPARVPYDKYSKNSFDREEIRKDIYEKIEESYSLKEKIESPERMNELLRFVMISAIDRLWKDHLYQMDDLRHSIGLRVYGQKDPLIEYKQESFDMFQNMVAQIKNEIVTNVFRTSALPADLAQILGQQPEDLAYSDVSDALTASFIRSGRAEMQAGPEAPQQPRMPYVRKERKIGRNEPCPCGSGKKYKKCCGASE